ncbi:MAG: phosphatase PAP2 family protein [Longicatena sp.]|nr:phosphatase PAP2 family protein [Longicatena sp.]
MKQTNKSLLCSILTTILFIIFTIFVKVVDVKLIPTTATFVGFGTLNLWFHQLTKENLFLYQLGDWLSIIPLLICVVYALIGCYQLIKRKSIFKFDYNLLILGFYYVLLLGVYLLFEVIPVNYRPILINGALEVSYPSSTTLLVLCIMKTFAYNIKIYLNDKQSKRIIISLTMIYSIFMIIIRILSKVHWITDIIGAILLSNALYYLYQYFILIKLNRRN